MLSAKEYIKQIEQMQKTDSNTALVFCSEAISAYPQLAQLYYLKASILWNKSEVFDLPRREFTELLKKATDLDPHYSAPHCLWAYANELLGYPELALEGYERAVAANPTDWEAWESLGCVKRELGDIPGALEVLNKVIDNKPEPSDRAYNERGHIRLESKDYANAIEDFNHAIDVNPKAGGSLWGRGLCKKALGDLQGALEDFSKMIELFPQQQAGYMDRGDVRLQLGDLVGALKDYQTVWKDEPDYEDVEEKIKNLQNQLLAQIPAGTQALSVTLKNGQAAMQIPFQGEMLTFIKFQSANEISNQHSKTSLPGIATTGAEGVSKEPRMQMNPHTLQKNFIQACWMGKVEQVETALQQGAEINRPNSFGETALGKAIMGGNPEVVQLLVQSGADVNQSYRGNNLLKLAQNKGNQTIISLLKSAGAKE